MANTDITSKEMDGMGPHGTVVGLLRVLGPAHVWALGVGIVLVGEYMGWNFAVGKGGAYAALIACWFAGILYTCVAMIDSEVTSTVAAAGGQYTQAKHIVGPLMAFNVAIPDLRLYHAGGGQRDHGGLPDLGCRVDDRICGGSLTNGRSHHHGHRLFLAWLAWGVLATLTFNLVITAIAFVAIIVLFLSTLRHPGWRNHAARGADGGP